MGANLLSSYESDHEEDDYIDMEVGLYASSSVPYPHHGNRQNPGEFEFHMSSASMEAPAITSPADELFYDGKILPLYPPTQHQIVEKILHFSNRASHGTKHSQFSDSNEELFSTPLLTNTSTTPFESCNASPFESCRVSKEMNPEDHLFDNSITKEEDSTINSNADFVGDERSSKKSWTRKIKLIKQSSLLGSKLKASTAYLKSLFSKTDHSKAAAEASDLNGKDQTRSSFVQRTYSEEDKKNKNTNGSHRRSFSVSIKGHSSSTISSSSSLSSSSSSSSLKSSSKKSDGFTGVQLLKRSSSANSGFESPIQGAIAHCKRSHQRLFPSRKALYEVGYHSFTASRLSISEDQGKITSLCRG